MLISAHEEFFSTKQNMETLQVLAKSLRKSADPQADSYPIMIVLAQMIELMISSANLFDKYCTSNIDWIGRKFINEAHDFPNLDESTKSSRVTPIFTLAYRFLCEYQFMQPSEASIEIISIENFVDEHMDKFAGRELQQILFAKYAMPAKLTKKILQDPSVLEFLNFSKAVDSAKAMKSEWDTEIQERVEYLHSIKQSLKDATSSYNFVGLVDGFRQLATVKIKEKKFAFTSLVALAILMLFTPLSQVLYVINNIEIVTSKKDILVYTLPTIIAIEVVIIYFFRVVLSQFRSVKAQILQIDLRIALCQFVQSYAEYAKNVKSNDPNILSKFESLVFSNLVPENESIPSTFDGTEQLTNLFKSIRGT